MIQEAATATTAQAHNPTLLIVIAGLASTITILAKGALDLAKAKYRESAKGDRREGGSDDRFVTLTAQMAVLTERLAARADDIERIEADLQKMHNRYHELSGHMTTLIGRVEVLLRERK